MGDPVLNPDEMQSLVQSIDERDWPYLNFRLKCWPVTTEDWPVPRELALRARPDQVGAGAASFALVYPDGGLC